MDQENSQNASKIAEILEQKFINQNCSKIKILDICCGVFDPNGTNYDSKGHIYQPLVAQKLGQCGFDVTGVDFRKGQTLKEIEDSNKLTQENVKYVNRSDINILEENWQKKLEKNWDVLIFLRSWDTPEILLHYQKTLNIHDLNLLSLEIAKIYLPVFANLLAPNGLFITTDICNLGVCDDEFEIEFYKNQTQQLLKKNGFELLNEEGGLNFFKKYNS